MAVVSVINRSLINKGNCLNLLTREYYYENYKPIIIVINRYC